MKITVADSSGIDSFPQEVAGLLEILGHPEALVTDESWISDFIDMTLAGEEFRAAKEKIYVAIEDRWKVNVRGLVSILAICRKVAAQNQSQH